MSLEYEVTFEPSAADTNQLAQGLSRYEVSEVGDDGFRPVEIFIRDEDVLLADVSGLLSWNWLQISLLGVDEKIRKEGLGSELIDRIETVSRDEGCTHAHVSTFSFQASQFCESQGYERFANFDDYPPGQASLFYKKAL